MLLAASWSSVAEWRALWRLWSKAVLKAGPTRSGWPGPCPVEFWASPRRNVLTTSLDSHPAFDHPCRENLPSSWGFLCCNCPLPLVLLLCTSKKSLAPSSLYPPTAWLQAALKIWLFIFFRLNKPSLQLAYLWRSCKRCRCCRGLLAFQLLLAFQGEREQISAGMVPVGERLLRLACLLQMTSLNSFCLQTLYSLCQAWFVCKQVQLKGNSLPCQTCVQKCCVLPLGSACAAGRRLLPWAKGLLASSDRSPRIF